MLLFFKKFVLILDGKDSIFSSQQILFYLKTKGDSYKQEKATNHPMMVWLPL